MTYMLAILFSLGILGYVLYPLFQKRYQWAGMPTIHNSGLENLIEAKKEALRALKEIDFEYQLGKMSQEDYEALKTDYQQRAIQILRQIDQLQHTDGDEDFIERQIRQYRQRLKGNKANHNDWQFCPQCGKSLQSEYQFCIYCGQELNNH